MIKAHFFIAAAATTIALTGLGACSYAQPTATDIPAAAATIDGPVATSGTFSGRSDHVTTGSAAIIGTAGNYTLVLGEDFTLDGAPDPVVGFGNTGTYDAGSEIGSLKQITGAQTYSLPADFDPAAYGEVYVWCAKFSVPLGVATLENEAYGS